MKKNSCKGFMLAETLLVTAFVAGVLIFLFIQFTNINKNYNDSFKYNSVEGMYALDDIKNYILEDQIAHSNIITSVDENKYVNITDCSLFFDNAYCIKMFELENIKNIIVTKNAINKELFVNEDADIIQFINKINAQGEEKYRIIAQFNNDTYATIRFGE